MEGRKKKGGESRKKMRSKPEMGKAAKDVWKG